MRAQPGMPECIGTHGCLESSVRQASAALRCSTDRQTRPHRHVVSYLRAAMKEGLEINQRVRLPSHDLLVSTNRPTAGVGYQRLESALERLAGTRIQTNIKTNGLEVTKNFGLIDEWEAVRRDGWEGRLLSLDIKLSDWFFNALQADELLSINRDYFRLRKPLERRIYEIGRKNCGEQRELAIGLDKLKKETGSKSPDKKFKFLIKKIVESDSKSKNFPDYGLYLNDNVLVYKNRRTKKPADTSPIPPLAPWAIERAKKAAPGYDIYGLEDEWQEWIKDKPPPEKVYEVAFIGFCNQKPPLR